MNTPPRTNSNNTLNNMKTAAIYARVSSTNDRQNTDRQIADLERFIALNDYTLVSTFTEKMSGAKENRPVLNDCVEFCIAHRIDTLCVSEISRLGRSVKIVVDTIDQLTKAHVNIYIQNLPLNTLNPDKTPNAMATMITCILGSFAQIERDNIKYRLNSGRALAIANGVKLGRKIGSVKTADQKRHEYNDVIKALRKHISVRDTAKLCNVSISTVQRLKKEFGL